MALLELDHVTKRFGRVVIAEDLSFTVDAGETVGIVGPNGAGKTSLFGLISGDLTPGAGQVNFAGRNITRLDPAARARLGVGRTYQVPRPFTDMTVFENVLVAAQQGGRQRRKASYAAAADALERTGIAVEANTPAGRLGLLARKRLEIARALATGPSVLLLDEVAGGLTDPEVTVLVEIVRAINAEKTNDALHDGVVPTEIRSATLNATTVSANPSARVPSFSRSSPKSATLPSVASS